MARAARCREQLRHAAFLHRIAEREGISVGSKDRVGLKAAERHARAVLEVVRVVLLPDEVDAIAQRLREEARTWLRGSQPRHRPVIAADAFLERVATAAHFDRERALRATVAVLETLAERLAAGEVDDLEALLPGELTPPSSGASCIPAARPRGSMSRNSWAAFDDVLAELPREYDDLLGR